MRGVRTRSGRGAGLEQTWTQLHVEQRVAAVAALLLIASTLGPFSFIEAAQMITAGAVLLLLKQRAEGRAFHLPLGDGTAVAVAGLWCAALIATRMFDRPPGQTVLALACALLLAAAGARERAKREPDDLPTIPLKYSREPPIGGVERGPAGAQAPEQVSHLEPPSSRL